MARIDLLRSECERGISGPGRFFIEETAGGGPTLRTLEGAYLHSRYDPGKEAARLTGELEEGDSVLVIAPGLSYCVTSALKRVGRGRVVVMDPLPEATLLSIESGLLGDEAEDERLEWRTVGTVADAVGLLSSLDDRDMKVIVNEAAVAALDDSWSGLKTLIGDISLRRSSSIRFREEMERNLSENAPLAARMPGITGLKDIWEGRTVIVAGGGPSLLESAGILKGRPAPPIVAVGTALLPLMTIGIEPEMAVVTDPQEHVIGQIESCPDWRGQLILFPTVPHPLLTVAPERTRIAFPSGEGGRPWEEMRRAKGELPAGGSVITTATGLAIHLGAARIVWIGLDLVETKSRTHSPGTYRESEEMERLSRFITMERLASGRRGGGEAEGGVLVRRNLDLYGRALERIVARERDRVFVQTALSGRRIEGAEHLPPHLAIGSGAGRETGRETPPDETTRREYPRLPLPHREETGNEERWEELLRRGP